MAKIARRKRWARARFTVKVTTILATDHRSKNMLRFKRLRKCKVFVLNKAKYAWFRTGKQMEFFGGLKGSKKVYTPRYKLFDRNQ